MGDLFEEKSIKPMLIGAAGEAFDDENYIFELKLDGERCIAYLDINGTELRNKRNVKMLPKVPELSKIHKCVKKKCILDGELIILNNGKPDFSAIQSRSLMSNKFKIELAAKKTPATFVAYDILYIDGKQLTDLPLMERKRILEANIEEENQSFAVSRYSEGLGISLYEQTKLLDLEGIVAKRRDSKYYFDKRTKDWIKIKYLKDEDFIICGYILKSRHMASIVLGQLSGGEMIYKGHAMIGVSREEFKEIAAMDKADKAPFGYYPVGNGNERAVWVRPTAVCTVKYMEKTKKGGLRQAEFKGLRYDKTADECVL